MVVKVGYSNSLGWRRIAKLRQVVYIKAKLPYWMRKSSALIC